MSLKGKISDIFIKFLKHYGYENNFLQKFEVNCTISPLRYFPNIFDKNNKIIFFDVGSNEGQTIEVVKRIFQKAIIYSFEPTPNLYDKLNKKYLKVNDIFISDIALGDYTGSTKFYTSPFSPTNSTLKPNVQLYEEYNILKDKNIKLLKEIKVPIMKLDDFCEIRKIEKIDILKIDTQGSELNVLKGSKEILKDRVKTIMLEIQFQQFYINAPPFYKIFEFLYCNNFILFDFFQMQKYGNNILLECDVIFLNKNFFKNILS